MKKHLIVLIIFLLPNSVFGTVHTAKLFDIYLKKFTKAQANNQEALLKPIYFQLKSKLNALKKSSTENKKLVNDFKIRQRQFLALKKPIHSKTPSIQPRSLPKVSSRIGLTTNNGSMLDLGLSNIYLNDLQTNFSYQLMTNDNNNVHLFQGNAPLRIYGFNSKFKFKYFHDQINKSNTFLRLQQLSNGNFSYLKNHKFSLACNVLRA